MTNWLFAESVVRSMPARRTVSKTSMPAPSMEGRRPSPVPAFSVGDALGTEGAVTCPEGEGLVITGEKGRALGFEYRELEPAGRRLAFEKKGKRVVLEEPSASPPASARWAGSPASHSRDIRIDI